MNAQFTAGMRVYVRLGDRAYRGHVRTPRYVRGKQGIIERFCGTFDNPEELAYGRRTGERVALYRVRFSQRELWDDYTGSDADAVDVELYEHWLAAVGE